MRVVAQRVSRATVRVDGRPVAAIGQGLLLLVGVARGDSPEQARKAARRFASLRVFEDGEGKLNRGVDDVGGEILVVSQFTVVGSIRRGRRPDFFGATPPEEAERLIEIFVAEMRSAGARVATGRFRAHMEVELVNDGPVTLIWDDPPGPGGVADETT